jgi:hypothetical protein
MRFGACKLNTPSRMQFCAIIYAIASCVNLREELLALQASLPMVKTAMIGSLTLLSRLLVTDFIELFSRKATFLS